MNCRNYGDFVRSDLGQGFARKDHSMQTNPILWDRTLYISTSANWVIAIDAASGVERWRFDAVLPKEIDIRQAPQGVSVFGMATRWSARAECFSALWLVK